MIDEREFHRLSRLAEEQYQLDLRAAAAKRDETLRSLQLVRCLNRSASVDRSHRNGMRKRGVVGAIRKLLPQMPSTFSINELTRAIRDSDLEVWGDLKQTSVSTAARRLVDAGELRVLVQGKGKRAARYGHHAVPFGDQEAGQLLPMRMAHG